MDPSSNPQSIPTGSASAKDEKTTTYDPVKFNSRLSDEYKLLQDKIDKIGAFRFTIKGWAVTIVGVVSAAASALSGSRLTIIISVALAAIVIFFFELEVEQIRLSRLFGDRARELERLFRSIDRGQRFRVLPPVPYTAHEIAKASYQRQISNGGRSWIARGRARVKEVWKLGRAAHRGFYVMLLILTMLPLLHHRQEITDFLTQMLRIMNDTGRGIISQFERSSGK